MPPLNVDLVPDGKETKGFIRFEDASGDGRIGKLYVPRRTLAALGGAERLTVTLAAGRALAEVA